MRARSLALMWKGTRNCLGITIMHTVACEHSHRREMFFIVDHLFISCNCRYSPHKDADPLKPREPAIIQHFIAYKNQDHGAWLRGGDVWLDACQWVLPQFNPWSSALCLWHAEVQPGLFLLHRIFHLLKINTKMRMTPPKKSQTPTLFLQKQIPSGLERKVWGLLMFVRNPLQSAAAEEH